MTTQELSVDAIAELAQEAAAPTEMEIGKKYLIVHAGGVDQVDNETPYRTSPLRKTGTFVTNTVESFCQYLDRHSTSATEVWADPQTINIVALMNGHAPEEPGFGDHRVKLNLQHTLEWKHWVGSDRKWMSQSAFAELVEDRLPDIQAPSSAEMLELAQTFQANNNVRFKSNVRLASGERQLEFTEDVEATAGRRGQLKVPETFTLGLRPFLGSDAWKIDARFRYRIHEGSLAVSYALNRPEDVLQEAVETLLERIREIAAPTLYYGSPPAA